MQPQFHLDNTKVQFDWSRDREPRMSVRSGADLSFETQDASAGQITASSGFDAITQLDLSRVNPVTGPVYVEGAKAGDTLEVEIQALEPSSFGWTAQIPGFGLLADDFPDPWLNVWQIEGVSTQFRDGIVVPVRPMCGILGVAPAAPGKHSVIPPRNVGGNLDIRQLGAGAKLYLPIEVEGALFGVGDTHAAQGDGEVCGTGIESPMVVHLRLTVRNDVSVRAPQFELPGSTRLDEVGGAYVCTGVEPDLLDAAREATRAMIDHLSMRYGLSPQEAYALCSVAVDLRISEVVDTPNWVVSAFLPSTLFRH